MNVAPATSSDNSSLSEITSNEATKKSSHTIAMARNIQRIAAALNKTAQKGTLLVSIPCASRVFDATKTKERRANLSD